MIPVNLINTGKLFLATRNIGTIYTYYLRASMEEKCALKMVSAKRGIKAREFRMHRGDQPGACASHVEREHVPPLYEKIRKISLRFNV